MRMTEQRPVDMVRLFLFIILRPHDHPYDSFSIYPMLSVDDGGQSDDEENGGTTASRDGKGFLSINLHPSNYPYACFFLGVLPGMMAAGSCTPKSVHLGRDRIVPPNPSIRLKWQHQDPSNTRTDGPWGVVRVWNVGPDDNEEIWHREAAKLPIFNMLEKLKIDIESDEARLYENAIFANRSGWWTRPLPRDLKRGADNLEAEKDLHTKRGRYGKHLSEKLGNWWNKGGKKIVMKQVSSNEYDLTDGFNTW